MKRETWLLIREKFAQGWSKRALARHFGFSRSKVRRCLNSKQPPRRSGGRRGSVLDGHFDFIKSELEQYPGITAARIHALLTEERGVDVAPSTVREHVRSLRPKAVKAYQTMRFTPGECAQVDWGTVGNIEVDGIRRRLSLFVMVLAHSRLLYAELCLSEKMEYWLAAHERAFKFFRGVPEKVMHDNLKAAVISNRPGEAVKFNPLYLDFSKHYGFKPIACTPYRPNQKGRVENAVGYIKKAFFQGRGIEHYPALKHALKDWLVNKANRRVHGTTGLIPEKAFLQDERSFLGEVPLPYDSCVIRSCQANSQFRVIIDTNRYSVPPQYASRRLQAKLYDDRIIILDDNKPIAEHPRNHGKRQDICQATHEEQLFSRNHHGRRQKLVAQFLGIGSAAHNYLKQLEERFPNPYPHLANVIAMAEVYGAELTHRAMEDTAAHSSFSGEAVAHLLRMRHKKKPSSSPLHLTRNADLLELKTPEINLDAYDIEKE